MIPVQSPYSPGLVAVVSGELSRYTDFEQSLAELIVPNGSKFLRVKGPSVARNRNNVVERLLKGTTKLKPSDGQGKSLEGLEWLMFLDDDHVVQPHTLMNLLSHDVNIVGALYSTKRPPFFPLAFKEKLNDEWYRHYSWTDLAQGDRLREVEAAGTGGMLIHKHVFTKIPEPWFHWGIDYSDDVYFCRKAKQAGFKVHVDTQTRLGHVSTMVVWPHLPLPGVVVEIDFAHLGIEDEPEAAAQPVNLHPTSGAQGELL